MAVLLLGALLAFLLVGITAGRAVGTRDAYFVAGRTGSGLAIGGSLFATAVGGSATVGAAGLAYDRGLTGAWWTLVGAIGLLLLGVVVAPRVRRYAAYTLPGIAGQMYGPRVGVAVALLTVVAWIGVVSGQLVAAARVLSVAGQGSPTLWTIIFTGVLVAYASSGGQKAVIRTDLLQGALILVGTAGTLLYVVGAMGGMAQWAMSAPVGSLDFPVSQSFGWSQLGTMLVLVGSVYIVGPDIYTRLLSARDARTAKASAIGAAALIVPTALVVSGLGISARILAPGLRAEQALPWLASNALPLPVAFLLLTGLLAALMSSADSTLLGQASIMANDVIARLVPMDDARVVTLAKVGVFVLAAISLMLALSFQGVISSLMFAYSVFTSGVVGPVLVGLLARQHRPHGAAALAGICVGGLCGLAGAGPWLAVPFKGQLPIVGLALSVVLPLLLSALFKRVTVSANAR